MITIEQFNQAMTEVSDGYTEFILNPDILDYTDLLESHRYMINELGLSFWIAELSVSENESETIVYIKSKDNKTINILEEGLPEFNSLEEYIKWLDEMEDKSNLIFNK